MAVNTVVGQKHRDAQPAAHGSLEGGVRIGPVDVEQGTDMVIADEFDVAAPAVQLHELADLFFDRHAPEKHFYLFGG